MSLPHAASSWLLRCGLDVALAGDLLEERARGRSAFWYWRQVTIAIWLTTWRSIFHHKLLALRALFTGCAVNALWLFLWERFLHIGLPAPPTFSLESLECLSLIMFTQSLTGWVVARTHRPHALPMVLVFGMWLVIWYPGYAYFSDVGMMLKDSIGQRYLHPASRHISPGFSCPSLPNWLDSSLEAWSARALASSHLRHHDPEQLASTSCGHSACVPQPSALRAWRLILRNSSQ